MIRLVTHLSIIYEFEEFFIQFYSFQSILSYLQRKLFEILFNKSISICNQFFDKIEIQT